MAAPRVSFGEKDLETNGGDERYGRACHLWHQLLQAGTILTAIQIEIEKVVPSTWQH